MPNFIYLPKMGYIDTDNIVQVYSPNGGDVDLDNSPAIAVRFATPIYDGNTETHITLITDQDTIQFLITALELAKCPHNFRDLLRQLGDTD